MFESVAAAPPDPILGLSEAFNKDTRVSKVNLTIGVFKDDSGKTPILSCVKKAEAKLLDTEKSKGYLGIDGDIAFRTQVRSLVLAGCVDDDRVAICQTPGGTGALRVTADFLGKNYQANRIWLSTPTWPNHPAIFESAGLAPASYPYLSADKKSLDFNSMMEALRAEAKAGDAICLHACCHNPTGVDPTAEQWDEISQFTKERGMLPVVDFAYHGFGDGLEEDRTAIKALTKHHDELLICSSYSKNFGLYGERIGALTIVGATAQVISNVKSSVKLCVRSNYSNPPRHGGAIVATVLEDSELKSLWHSELAAMRDRIHKTRDGFVAAMKERNCPIDFSFLTKQKGMFSFSGLSPMQVDRLRNEHGIYIVGSGRINVAGITPGNIDVIADAIVEVVSA